MKEPVVIQMQRYRVSLWTHHFSAPNGGPGYVRKETVSSTPLGALRNIMHLENIPTTHRAKVVTLRTGSCQWLQQVGEKP